MRCFLAEYFRFDMWTEYSLHPQWLNNLVPTFNSTFSYSFHKILIKIYAILQDKLFELFLSLKWSFEVMNCCYSHTALVATFAGFVVAFFFFFFGFWFLAEDGWWCVLLLSFDKSSYKWVGKAQQPQSQIWVPFHLNTYNIRLCVQKVKTYKHTNTYNTHTHASIYR